MAAGPVQVYHNGLLKVATNDIDFATDTVHALLLDTIHTPNLATHEFISNVVVNEIADVGYARQIVGTKSIALVGGKVVFDCADISFGDPVSISARYLVIAKIVTIDADSPLLFICDLNTGGGNLSSTAAAFSVAINAAGLHDVTPNVV